MTQFVHPATDDISLTGVLAALGDPTRLKIVRRLALVEDGCNCIEASPCPDMARSTLSNHFRILREAGLIRTVKKGVEHVSVLRRNDLDSRFPGLLDSLLGFVDA